MPSWTVPGTPIREQLREHAKRSSSKYLYSGQRSEEYEEMTAELQSLAKSIGEDWIRRTYITYADGPWLVSHAVDRGVPLVDGESDAERRARIRLPPDAVTKPAILAKAQAIVDASGVSGTVYAVEVRTAKAHFGSYSSESHADGGEFVALDGDEMEFRPTTPFSTVPIRDQDKLVVSGSAGNDGSHTITGFSGNAIRYTDAAGADEDLAAGTVKIEKYDQDGNVKDGFARAYFGRGYRMGSRQSPNHGILILPYGTSAATRLAVQAMVLTYKAFNVKVTVERRVSP